MCSCTLALPSGPENGRRLVTEGEREGRGTLAHFLSSSVGVQAAADSEGVYNANERGRLSHILTQISPLTYTQTHKTYVPAGSVAFSGIIRGNL